MSVMNIQEQLTGGESIYCINEAQMTRTADLMDGSNEIGIHLRAVLENLERELDRNELAALSFRIIERLNTGK